MRRVVIAGMIGNGLEWYDFALYGYFASTIGKLFTNTQDHYAQMLSAYIIFAAGFITRPLGGVLFGYLGDKFGRKFSLTVSLLMMAVPTACIGLLPTYAMIGAWAPILLATVRLLQGLSLAGQFSGSITFIVEHAPVGRRGLAGSAAILSLCGGMLLGSAVATLFAHHMSQESLEQWGWRVPFILGGAIAYVGFYIREYTEESPHYMKAKEQGTLSQKPVREALAAHYVEILRGIGIYMAVTVPFYTLTVFLAGYLHVLGHPMKDALLIGTLSLVVLMVLSPFTGWLTDKIGRKPVLMTTAVVYFITAYPIFILMTSPGFASALTGEVLFAVVVSFFIGAAPAIFVELFPTSIRYTGMSISYNICAALFGGTTPVVETWLVEKTHIQAVPAFYIMFCAAISLIALLGYHDRYKEELR